VRRVSREIEPDLAAEVYRKGAAAPFFAVSAELGVYNLLLSAYLLHLQDIFGGTPGLITTVHNRFSESLRETIGLVMEMAPVVIPGAAQDSLAAVAGRVKRASRQTFTWYAQGGVEALQELDLDVVFNLHAYPVLEFNGQTVDYWRVWPGHGSESLALGVNLTPETNRIQLHHDFHEDVFSPSEMDAISDRLVETLARALADPEAGLDRLRLGPNPLEERLPPVSEPVAEPSRQAPPRDYLEAELVKIWESVIKRSPIGIRDDFFDLGGSSWLATQLFATIQDTLGHNLPLSALLQATTIAQLAALIRSQRMSSPRSQLVPLKKGRSQPALFLVPGVGGNVLSLARLADGMAADENIFAFETQSIDGIRAGRPIREVAAHLIKVMRTHQPDGPYLIGGYSWGGMVAYEMATQLRTAGQSLAFVAILDTPAQGKWYGRLQAWIQRWGQSRGWDQPRTIDGFLKIRDPLFRFEYYLQTLFRKPGRLREEFKRQRWLDRQEGVRQRSGRRRIRAEGFWSQFDLEPVRHEMVMANDRYLRLHVPEPIDYPILLFRTVKGYLNPLVRSPYWDLGWKRLAQNGLELIPVPGNHIQMLKQPHVQEVSRLLQLQLDSARAMLDNE
jgi:thioesterase domain-containing protein/acyl carrier protein